MTQITPSDMEKLGEFLGLENISVHDYELRASCPFAPILHITGKDSRPSFAINLEKGVYNCFSCGSRGIVESLVSYTKDVSMLQAMTILEDIGFSRLDVAISTLDETEKISEVTALKNALLLQFKKIDGTCIEMYEGDIDGEDSFIFPVRDYVGNLVGAMTRGKTYKTHRNIWGLQKSEYLYGEDYLVDGEREPLIVVEGPKDVEAIKRSGYNRVVALMGAIPSRTQKQKLVRYADEIIVWLDNDSAGKNGYLELQKLEDLIDIKFVVMHFGTEEKDANAVYTIHGYNVVRSYIENTKTSLELYWEGVLNV